MQRRAPIQYGGYTTRRPAATPAPPPRPAEPAPMRSWIDQPDADEDEDAWNDALYDRARTRAAEARTNVPHRHLVPKSRSHHMKDIVVSGGGLPKNLAFQGLEREKLAQPKELPRMKADRDARWAALDRQYMPKKGGAARPAPRPEPRPEGGVSAVKLMKKAEALSRAAPKKTSGEFSFQG